jgi:hypothetical protein
MAKPCSTCTDRRRREIDEAMLRGTAVAEIARTFGRSESALRRHREHVAQVAALAQQDHARDLILEIEELKQELQRIQAQGRTGGDWKQELAALDRRLRLLELQARVTGEARPQRQTNILNVTVDAKTAERMAAAFLARQRLLRAGGDE